MIPICLIIIFTNWFGLYLTNIISWPFYKRGWSIEKDTYIYKYSSVRLNPGVSEDTILSPEYYDIYTD